MSCKANFLLEKDKGRREVRTRRVEKKARGGGGGGGESGGEWDEVLGKRSWKVGNSEEEREKKGGKVETKRGSSKGRVGRRGKRKAGEGGGGHCQIPKAVSIDIHM